MMYCLFVTQSYNILSHTNEAEFSIKKIQMIGFVQALIRVSLAFFMVHSFIFEHSVYFVKVKYPIGCVMPGFLQIYISSAFTTHA